MVKAKTSKIAKIPVRIPKDSNEADEFLRLIQELEQENEQNQQELEAQIAATTAQYLPGFTKNIGLIEQYAEGLFHFAQANREELTQEGKTKTVNLPSGSLLWRMTPPKVSIQNVEQVLEELVRLRLRGFIRRTPSINKEAMLQKPDVAKTVKGVTIDQHEEFVIKLKELLAEVTAAANNAKKVKIEINDLRPKPKKETKASAKKQAG